MDRQYVIIKTEIGDDEPLPLPNESDQEHIMTSTEEGAHSSHVSDTSTRKPRPSKASGSRLSAYNKSEILKCLMTNGCSAWSTAEAISRFKVDPERLLKYFNQQAGRAQHHVGEECESLSFENINAWLSCLEKVGLHEFCDFESALVIKSIADNEKHPCPSENGGIDLKSIYKFLGNALMGLPQTALDAESAKFLTAEFEDLINDVNTNFAEIETKHMKEILHENINHSFDASQLRGILSLDPLAIDDDITKYI